MVVEEARALALKEILPTSALGDREGCRFGNGTVSLPKQLRRPWECLAEGDWIVPCAPAGLGGQGMPKPVTLGRTSVLKHPGDVIATMTSDEFGGF